MQLYNWAGSTGGSDHIDQWNVGYTITQNDEKTYKYIIAYGHTTGASNISYQGIFNTFGGWGNTNSVYSGNASGSSGLVFVPKPTSGTFVGFRLRGIATVRVLGIQ